MPTQHYGASNWIWEKPDWPDFQWKHEVIEPRLRQVRLKQVILLGKSGAVSDDLDEQVALDTLLQNIITSSAIEGEQLNAESVRSSLAKRVGINLKHAYPVSDRSEGLAKLMLDAIQNLDAPLSTERLFQWHHWLFPDNTVSLHAICVGALRGDELMQVVSGRLDKPRVHFEAPPRACLERELHVFITWFNQSRDDATLDPLLRAAITHFWFITLHPFGDGNGRITRTLTDLALAEADKQSIRLYAMSPTILAKRKAYYHVLEKSQRNTLDITTWLMWFLDTLEETFDTSIDKIERTFVKIRFWQRYQVISLSVEQRKVLNRLLGGGEKGFPEGMSATHYQKVAKVSKATATRHLTDLLAKGCLEKLPGGGEIHGIRLKNKATPNPHPPPAFAGAGSVGHLLPRMREKGIMV